jgi:oligoribonuclease
MNVIENTLIPWVDIETSGLGEHNARAWIGEIGFAVTDVNLNVVDMCSYVVLPDEKCRLPNGTYWVEADVVNQMHLDSGLFADLYDGDGIPLDDAVRKCMNMLSVYMEPGTRPLAGSSLRHDRNWLARFAPDLHDFFHYRSIDVSSLKEIVNRWWPNDVPEPVTPPVKAHRVAPDIMDSIEELRGYMAILESGITPPNLIFQGD